MQVTLFEAAASSEATPTPSTYGLTASNIRSTPFPRLQRAHLSKPHPAVRRSRSADGEERDVVAISVPTARGRRLEWAGTTWTASSRSGATWPRRVFSPCWRDPALQPPGGRALRRGRKRPPSRRSGSSSTGTVRRELPPLVPAADGRGDLVMPMQTMLAYPLATFLRFCDNHGLLQVSDRRSGSRWPAARVST